MADILIRGMEMPKNEPLTITITPDGKVFRAFIPGSYGEAAQLPEGHGRLIDADKLLIANPELSDCDFYHPKYDCTLRELIADAPTIVPAEGGTDK